MLVYGIKQFGLWAERTMEASLFSKANEHNNGGGGGDHLIQDIASTPRTKHFLEYTWF